MTKPLHLYTESWVCHVPELKDGNIELVPSEIPNVSSELAKANNSDPIAAIELIKRLCIAVEARTDIDDRILRFVTTALHVLIKNDEINLAGFAKSLGIKRDANRPKKSDRDRTIYFDVVRRMTNMSYGDACLSVANKVHLSEERIKSIYKTQKKLHLQFLEEMDSFSSEVTEADWQAILQLFRAQGTDD